MKYSTKAKAFVLSVILSGTNMVSAMHGAHPNKKMGTPEMKAVLSIYGIPFPEKNYNVRYEPGVSESSLSVWKCGKNSKDEIVVKCYKKSSSSDISYNSEKKISEILDKKSLSPSRIEYGPPSKYVIAPKTISIGQYNLTLSKHSPSLSIKELQSFIKSGRGGVQRTSEQKFQALKTILKGILGIVAYLDKDGILHGDLHFGNLIFTINDGYELEVKGFDFDNSCIKSDYNNDPTAFERKSMQDLCQLVYGMSELIDKQHSGACFNNDEDEKQKIKDLDEIFGNIQNTIEDIADGITLATDLKKSYRPVILTLLSDIINSVDKEQLISNDIVQNTLNEIRKGFGLNDMEWVDY